MKEIRRLLAEERPLYERLNSIVFNFRRDFSKEREQKEKDKASGLPNENLDAPPEWFWGVFEKGKLISGMVEFDYLMSFDGHAVPMSGIGGVGTLPEARKGGLVRSVFEKLLPEAHERGVVFSGLCPFSHDFYRKFGYEICCARNRISVPTDKFYHLKLKGGFTQIFPGDDCSALNEIQRKYISGLNQGIFRDYWPDSRAWKIFSKDDPYATGTFLYLWRDDHGNNKGYIKYKDATEENAKHFIDVQELAFIDRGALYGVLSLIGGLGAQFKRFQWLMPSFIDPTDLLGTAWDIEQILIPRDMGRVVNVKAALEKMRRPQGEGSYTIHAYDDLIPANCEKYLVEYGPEGSRVYSTQKEADILCDIQTLSQLVIGYRTLENVLLTRQTGVEVMGNREILDKVFTLRPQHVTEYF